MNWNAAGIAVIITMVSAAAATNSPLLPGHYKRVEPAGGFPALDITAVPSDISVVVMHSMVSRPNCSGALDVKLEYSLPATYKGETVNYTSASCTGAVMCPGFIFKCNGVGRAGAVFSQVRKDTVTAKSAFWGGLATFRSAAAAPSASATSATEKPDAVGFFKTKEGEGTEKTGILTAIK
jgi:hypothetical protein